MITFLPNWLPRFKIRTLPLLILSAALAVTTVYASFEAISLQRRSDQIGSNLELSNKKLQDAALQEQINILEKRKLEELKKTATASATPAPDQEKLAKVQAVLDLYQNIVGKVKRNDSAKLNSKDITDQYNSWGNQLLANDLDVLKSAMDKSAQTLDSRYNAYLASLPKPPAPAPAPGYSYQTVSTVRGSFGAHLIKMKLGEVTVRTVTANSSDCTNNCPVKPLESYISENGAYAGMNGTYLCPPDYSSCAGKVNSYDFPVYNSNLGKWLNYGALSWTSQGLATFVGNSPKFYRYNNQYPKTAVTAGISNFPTILLGGTVQDTEAEQTDYQKLKGTKGSIGTDGTYIYLALISGANVTDSAYALQAMGVKDALNLDGGGTSAMYISGSYKVGPGRLLPNAVLLIKN